ncbi:MAG: hypothetical protein K6T73_10660 [Candidatus Bathyarchaeota archaeon]|nr:hypothetical protein [Candidatus Bathyarchaeota archaeon]
MQAKSILFSAILCLTALFLFIYGLYTINPKDPISGSYMVVLGIFLGIAGLFMLVSQLTPNRPAT